MAAVTHVPITGFVISTKNTPTRNTVSGAKIRRIENARVFIIKRA